ncbi:MAG: hypothetical protein IJM08_00250, partial [Firmicutes bacterium]|nr:hypothetical protein [Bacillota bacterium]
TTKKGQNMAFVTMEDLYGDIELVVFPKTFELDRQWLALDNIIIVRGRLDIKEDTPKLLAERIVLLDDYNGELKGGPRRNEVPAAPKQEVPMIKIVIPENYSEREGLLAFKRLAKANRGDTPVAILVKATNNKYKLDYDLWIDPSPNFITSAKRMFGEDCFR